MGFSVAWMLLAGALPVAAAQRDTRTVLMLYSEQWMGPATADFTQGLRETLASSPTVALEAQHLDIVRFAGDEHDSALADWLHSRYDGRRLAAVVALGDPASVFAMRYGEAIWPGVRLIHASVDGDQVRKATERGEPVIPRPFQYRRTVEHALLLWPAVRRVWLIAGSTDQDHRWPRSETFSCLQHAPSSVVLPSCRICVGSSRPSRKNIVL